MLRVRIDLSERLWQRHANFCFTAAGDHRRTSRVIITRDHRIMESGVAGYVLLKTRPMLATSLDASWHYRAEDISWTPAWHGVMKVITDTFATHDCASDHDMLYTIGEAVLAQCEQLRQIRLSLPR